MRQAGALALRQSSQRNRGLERDRLQRALKKSEIVAILGLLALFTHIHLFWVAGLLLAMIELGLSSAASCFELSSLKIRSPLATGALSRAIARPLPRPQ